MQFCVMARFLLREAIGIQANFFVSESFRESQSWGRLRMVRYDKLNLPACDNIAI